MKYILIIIMALMAATPNFSQTFKISDGHVKYDKHMRPAVKLHVQVPEDEVKDYLNDYVKDKFDSNLKGYGLLVNKDEVKTEYQSMPLLADRAVRLIGVFEERGKYTNLYLIGQWENEEYITKKSDRSTYANVKQTGRDFIKYFLPDYLSERASESQEALEDVVSELEDLQETLASDKEDLVKLEEEMEELEEEIEKNTVALKDLRKGLEEKRKIAESDKEKLNQTREALAIDEGKESG